MTRGIHPNQVKADYSGGNFPTLQSLLDQYIIKTVGFPIGNVTTKQTITLTTPEYYIDVNADGSGGGNGNSVGANAFLGFETAHVEGFRLASSGSNITPKYLGDGSANGIAFTTQTLALIAPIYVQADPEETTPPSNPTTVRTLLVSAQQPTLVNLCDLRDANTHNQVNTPGGDKVWGLLYFSANEGRVAGQSDSLVGGNHLYMAFMTFDSSEFAVPYQLPAGTYDFTYNVVTQKKHENGTYYMDSAPIDVDVLMPGAVTTYYGAYTVGVGGVPADTDISKTSFSPDGSSFSFPTGNNFRDSRALRIYRNGIEQFRGNASVHNDVYPSSASNIKFSTALAQNEVIMIYQDV